jgi:predicted lysophospholipase L1 biosynthesis ABC-type transport system permease subunit
VTAGTPAARDLPLDLYATDISTIPIVVSRAVADRADGVRVGDEFPVLLKGHKYPMRVVGIVDDVPGLDAGELFAIASRQQMTAVNVGTELVTSTIFLRAPPDAGPGIRQAVATALPNAAVVASRADETAALRDAPTARAVLAGTAAGAIVAFLYAVLAVAAGLALTGAAQAVEVAHLRTMGLSNRQLVGLVIAEHGPIVVAALVAGVALGLGMFAFLREGLGLDVLVGAQTDVSLLPDPTQLAAVLGGIVAVVVFGLGLGTIMQRGVTSTAAQRRGFE